MKSGKYLWLFLLLGALIVAPRIVYAQGQSVITGLVRDGSGAVVPDVAVTLSSPQMLGGARAVTTSAAGVYRFLDMPPGDYALTVERQGFKTVTHSGLHVFFGATLTFDVAIEVSGTTESLQVLGRAPVIDTKSSSSSLTLDNAILQNVPPRNMGGAGPWLSDVIRVAPGVINNSAYGSTSASSNAIILDGVLTNEVSGGGPGLAQGSNNWLEEVQIVGLGANAQYGGFTGLAVNMVLKSGSNRFSGMSNSYTKSNSWVGDNRGNLSPAQQTSFKPQRIVSNWIASEQAGGPIVKDKLFFFAGAELLHDDKAPTGSLGNAVVQEHHLRMVSKVNWAPASGTRINGYLTHWIRDGISGAGTRRQPETLGVFSQPTYNFNVGLTQTIGQQSLFEVHAGGVALDASILPLAPATLSGPAPRTDSVSLIASANVPSYLYLSTRLGVFAASYTSYVERVLGQSHELKVGLEHSRGSDVQESGFPGGMSFTDRAGIPDQVTLQAPTITSPRNRRYTAYVQDRWIVNDKITIEPGVRLSFNRGLVPAEEVMNTTPIEPRIGIAWDLWPDHKTLFRAHYGRFHDSQLTSVFASLDRSTQPPAITARVLADGTFQEINRVTPATNFGLDPDVSLAHMDQYVVGIERELLHGIGLQAQYIRRNTDNIMAYTDSKSQYAPVTAIDPGPDGVAGNGDDGSPLTVYNLLNPGQAFFVLTNPDGAYRTYDAVQVIGRKRFTNDWQVLASYTWAKSRGTIDNVTGTSLGQGDASRTGSFANPNAAINRDQRSTNDNTHQVKLLGTYRLPVWGGVNLSTSYQYSTGSAYSRTIIVRGLAQGNQTVRVAPRGDLRADATNITDFRVEKTFPLGGARALGVYVDAFNLFDQGFAPTLSEASGPTFNTPLTYSESRSLLLGARFTF